MLQCSLSMLERGLSLCEFFVFLEHRHFNSFSAAVRKQKDRCCSFMHITTIVSPSNTVDDMVTLEVYREHAQPWVQIIIGTSQMEPCRIHSDGSAGYSQTSNSREKVIYQ